MKIGFTGTQIGINNKQAAALQKLVKHFQPKEVCHGDCIGADSFFHLIVRFNLPLTVIRIFPPVIDDKRAWCKADIVEPDGEYLDRNKKIVDATDMLLATPKEKEEQLRSGTWSTIRYAKKTNKPYIIVFPDGSLQYSLKEEYKDNGTSCCLLNSVRKDL